MILCRLLRMDSDGATEQAQEKLQRALEDMAAKVPPGTAITHLEISQAETGEFIQVIVLMRTA